MSRFLRWMQRVLFACAFVALGYGAIVTIDSWMFQRREKLDLERLLHQSQTEVVVIPSPSTPEDKAPAVRIGGLIGRIDVARLGVSVAVVEGADTPELVHAAGHITGTAMPGQTGNAGIAAHRDTFFRPLRNISADDVIQVTTPSGKYSYRVVSIKVVKPDDVSVLNPDGGEILTLVTCYPFYYVGSAPDRFIVRAERTVDAKPPNAAALQPAGRIPHL